MKIEEGKYYRRRDGEVVGPARLVCSKYSTYPFEIGGYSYTSEGKHLAIDAASGLDLIEECPPNGTPVSQCDPDETPIMDNRAVLEKAMREGLPVRGISKCGHYTASHDVFGINGDCWWNGEQTLAISNGLIDWQIVEPVITAEDLCKAIDDLYSTATGFGSLGESYQRAKAKELADKYRKQQEKK